MKACSQPSKTFTALKLPLLKFTVTIVSAIEKQRYVVILLLLDLSAAFDTIEHLILVNRLSSRFDIHGKALQWFMSSLGNRKQVVNVNETTQGSVLEPLLCTWCPRPHLVTSSEATDYHIIFMSMILSFSIYTLSDLGVLSNLIGSLSLAN